MIDDDIRVLRDALADGPTPGPWVDDMESYRSASDVTIYSEARGELDYVVNIGYCGNKMEDGAYIAFDASAINARYIAAASPDRIARMLDEIERLRMCADELKEVTAAADDPRINLTITLAEYTREVKDEIERLRAEVSVAAREAQTLRNQRDELRIILDKRPAINDGLREAYAKWSAGVYALDWMDAADIDAACKEEGK